MADHIKSMVEKVLAHIPRAPITRFLSVKWENLYDEPRKLESYPSPGELLGYLAEWKNRSPNDFEYMGCWTRETGFPEIDAAKLAGLPTGSRLFFVRYGPYDNCSLTGASFVKQDGEHEKQYFVNEGKVQEQFEIREFIKLMRGYPVQVFLEK